MKLLGSMIAIPVGVLLFAVWLIVWKIPMNLIAMSFEKQGRVRCPPISDYENNNCYKNEWCERQHSCTECWANYRGVKV